MDLVVYSPGSASPAYIDVSIVSALSQAALAGGAANHDGRAAEIAAKCKHRSYPQISVTPFIVEDHGRFGDEAVKFLRSIAPTEPRLRSTAMRDLYQRLGAILQRHAADAVLAAITVRQRRSSAEPAVVVSAASAALPPATDIRLGGSSAAAIGYSSALA